MDIKKILDRLTELSEANPNQQISLYRPDGDTYRQQKMPNYGREDMYTLGEPESLTKKSDEKYDLIDPADSPDTAAEKSELKSLIQTKLKTLTGRERDVLVSRFLKGMTLEQTAKLLGVGRERIRQIEAKALRKMRHPDRSADLRAYFDESQTLARPKMPGAGMTPDTPKDVAKKTKKLDLFKTLEEELTETEVLRRISKKFEDFKHNLEEYGGYSGSTGTMQSQTSGTQAQDEKQQAAELQQTQKTLQTLKPQLQKAGAQNIDVNRMTQALAQVDDQPGQTVTGQTAQQLNKLAPGIADALKNPQSAQMLKTAIEKGEQVAQQQAQAQKRAWQPQQYLL